MLPHIGSGVPPLPIAYLPLDQSYQSTSRWWRGRQPTLHCSMKPVMAKVQRLDPNLALVGALTMPEMISRGLWAPRAGAALFGVFGLLGLALAALGIYGVMAYMVAQRTNEIGIRMALGARPGHVVRLVVGQGARLALAGIVFGIAAGLALSRLISGPAIRHRRAGSGYLLHCGRDTRRRGIIRRVAARDGGGADRPGARAAAGITDR